MNTILADYSTITELELNKHISFYEHSGFSTETIELLIPDVVPYVRKIFNCLRWATQNRKIVEDICHQKVDTRVSRNQLIQSIGYSVGTLHLDGRAYAQQNIHQYCRYVAETNDCLCQILNIVFGVGFRQWERFEMDQIRKHSNIKNHAHILTLWENYHALIKIHKGFDNFDKHNLILWGYEKLTPQSITTVEYYFDRDGQQTKMSDWINEAMERKIEIAIVELLDNIFALASAQNNPNRRFTHVLFDVLMTDNQPPVYSDRYLAKDNIIPVKISTKASVNRHIVDAISYVHDSSPIAPELYIARLDQEIIEDGIVQSNLRKLDFECFDVYSNGRMIGQYRCKNKKDRDIKYFHFMKYTFIPCKT